MARRTQTRTTRPRPIDEVEPLDLTALGFPTHPVYAAYLTSQR